MPRHKKENYVRVISPDPIYGSVLVEKFINVIMWRGKKSVARSIVYGALEELGKKQNADKVQVLDSFEKAFTRLIPAIEVRSRRVGGNVYQIPTMVNDARGKSLAMRWLIESAAARSDKTMSLRLANELRDALENRGGAMKKKQDVQKMAEANRAFSHYSW